MLNGDPRRAFPASALPCRSRTSRARAWSATRAAPAAEKGEKLLAVCVEGLAATLRADKEMWA